MKLIKLFLALFVSITITNAQSNHTITIDGTNDFTPDTEAFGNFSSADNGYFTWDANYIYLGIADVEADYGDLATFIYFDTDPEGTNGTVDAYAWGNNIVTPFAADYVVVWKNKSGADYIEVRDYNEGTTSWDQYDFENSTSLNTDEVNFAIGTDFREVRIKRSILGSPSSIKVTSFTEQQYSSNWRYFAWASDGWTDANRGAGQSIVHYHGFTLTDGYTPNHTNSYDYVMRKNIKVVSLDAKQESFFVRDDGTGDGANDLDVSSAYTFEVWINVGAYTSGDYDVIMDRRTVFSLYLVNDDNNDYALTFAARDGSDNIIASIDCDGTGSTSADMVFGTWYHVAVTYDGTTAKLFVNGTQMDSDTDADFQLSASTNAINIGGRYWGSSYSRQMQDCDIDEVRMSNIARSSFHSSVSDNAYMSDVNTIFLMHLDDDTAPPTYISGTDFNGTTGSDADFTSADYLAFGTLPLPVELTSFNALTTSNGILLNWQTATEVNNYGFEIERAVTSTSSVTEWEKIGFVEGHGNSNSPKNYEFTDTSTPLSASTVSYRLKQIDIDGNYEYSDVVEVNVANQTPSKYELSQNYPNPFNPTTEINFSIPTNENVSIKVFNLLGEEVAQVINKELLAGSHKIQFDASKLSSGIYFYKMVSGKFVSVKKMILMK